MSNHMKELLVLLLAMLSVSPAYADHDHGGGYAHEGGYRGGWSGGWIFPVLIGGAIMYDLTQPQVVVQPQTVYLQPVSAYGSSVAPAVQQYWYFCAAANAYYPYIASCPGGWQAVPVAPP